MFGARGAIFRLGVRIMFCAFAAGAAMKATADSASATQRAVIRQFASS
jgi:hypothetical protein